MVFVTATEELSTSTSVTKTPLPNTDEAFVDVEVMETDSAVFEILLDDDVTVLPAYNRSPLAEIEGQDVHELPTTQFPRSTLKDELLIATVNNSTTPTVATVD